MLIFKVIGIIRWAQWTILLSDWLKLKKKILEMIGLVEIINSAHY
jgi:hypothetical protein